MGLTVEQMQARLTTLRELKYSGVLETMSEGRRVRYRDMAELDRAIASLVDDIAAAEKRRRPRIVRPYAVKDL